MARLSRPATPIAVSRVLLGALLGALAVLCVVVLGPFIVPIGWAAALAYTSWPAYRVVQRFCRGRHTLAATVMTTVVVLVLTGPLLSLAVLLQGEIVAAYQAAQAYQADGTRTLPAFVRGIPWLGELAQRYADEPALIKKLIIDWAQRSRPELLGIAGTITQSVADLFTAIVTVFFFYRDGEKLSRQAVRVLRRFFGKRLDRYLRAAGGMTRAVVFGLLITALAQGTIAGIGYAVFGVEAPVLLGVLTALASIVPVVGTLLVWGSAGVLLMVGGHLWPGLGLLAWGTLLVHPADNIIRPLMISNVTEIPFLLVMFGVLGGLAAFGLIGLFIGPVVLAIATAVWREWSAADWRG